MRAANHTALPRPLAGRIMSSCRATPIPATGAVGSEPGVVHQHIHLDVLPRQRLHNLARTSRLAQVHGHDLRLDSVFRGEFAG